MLERHSSKTAFHYRQRIGLSLALGLSLSVFAAQAVAGKPDLPIPQLSPCSERYTEVADPAPPQLADSKEAIRQAFGTHDDWATDKNVTILSPAQTGIGETGMRVAYPAGTSSPGDKAEGGAGFYATIPALHGADRACLSYQVRFPEGFDFVKGGKLPGLYGGNAPSGGDAVTGDGYSMRFMWRRDGKGELYEYIVNKKKHYGKSVGRGLWHFPTGKWVTIEQEIVLNDPQRRNGIARVWVDGRPILEQRGIVYRKLPTVYADGLMFSTFFGGHGKSWRTPRDQHVDFADFRFYADRP
ncbi:polysaccharide lyase [Modicisalibacter sp. 'Wilcox']|uniref:polysaccharide lyase n=1 Tax=Modicisalibacter sp. 'Wilcox' TaxID=2679914 RepID=UPI0007957C09|nr:hypothetical protein [Modicisalibacter sp. 'Wilcox']KXS38698.1 MAG: hypothetical protein AWU55_1289 [Halomonadaceae bacterium T82-2]